MNVLQISQAFDALATEMNRFVVGHSRIKRGILLGLLAQEHVYIEGPPGMAKTMLAELLASCSALNFYLYQFHRDTRLAELIGDVVIQRETEASGHEIIAQSVRRGGVLTAELCVLDDISRAPGEALNILLRILNERQFQDEKIPLLSAIATSNPTVDDYYNEPLDPANLDRFTIQLQSRGLIQSQNWEDAERIIDLYAQEKPEKSSVPALLTRATFDEASALLPQVEFRAGLKKGLIHFLTALMAQKASTQSHTLLTDRSFLVKSVKIIKAQALLSGRMHTEPEDLRVLDFMTTFRIPEEHRAHVPAQLDQAIAHAAENMAGESSHHPGETLSGHASQP